MSEQYKKASALPVRELAEMVRAWKEYFGDAR